jgi:dipeptidyl-peptidase-3
MKISHFFFGLISCFMLLSCNSTDRSKENKEENFSFVLEQFADLRVLRYQVPGFDSLSLKQKELIYYLSQAALCGRDILWDQNGKYNLAVRKTLENIYSTYKGDRETAEFKDFLVYLKRIWFSNGIYHHYSTDKILPAFSKDYFMELIANSDADGFPLLPGKSKDESLEMLTPVIFDKNLLGKKVNQQPGTDLVAGSAVNFYQDITEDNVVAYYKSVKDKNDTTPISYGLNSRLIGTNGKP